MKYIILLFIITSLSFSCQQEQEKPATLETTWLGSHFDQSYVMPLNALLDFQENGELIVNFLGDTSEVMNWSRTGSQLLMDSTEYNIKHLSHEQLILTDDSDSSYTRYFDYRKINPSKQSLTVESIQKNLRATIWTDVPAILKRGLQQQQVIQYTADKAFIKRFYFYKGELLDIEEFEEFCYTVESYDGFFFIVYKNGLDTCKNTLPIEQIIVSNNSKFETLNFNHKDPNYWNSSTKQHKILQPYKGTHSFDLTNIDHSKIFHSCSDYRISESYQNNLVFDERGQSAMNDFFLSRYKKIKDGGSGIISVRFVINCNGDIGRFNFYQINERFKKTQFDREVIEQVIELTAQLEGWEPSLQTRTQKRDSYKNLKFRFKNGQLLEVFTAND